MVLNLYLIIKLIDMKLSVKSAFASAVLVSAVSARK